jgi:hypothetical protein
MLNWTFLKRALHVSAVCALLGLLAPSVATAAQSAPDLTPYKTMANDALKLVAAGDMAGASKKVSDLETKWDGSGMDLLLPDLDEEMDAVKDAVRSRNAKASTAELNTFLQMIARTSKPAAH